MRASSCIECRRRALKPPASYQTPSPPVSGPLDLPYNWSDKVRATVLGICLARSTVLQDIARTREGQVKTSEKDLSEFLAYSRLDLSEGARRCAVQTLRRVGLRRFLRYRGKLVLMADTTTYAKVRSRGKERRMPHIGTVRLHNLPSKETILVPGFCEFWTGLLLNDESCLGITRRLFTETMLGGLLSQNALEERDIRQAVELVREAFGVGVILVADRGLRRKDLLEWLKKDLRVDFVIRLDGNLRIEARGWKGLLEDLGPHWEERLRRFWRDDDKNPLFSGVGGEEVEAPLTPKKSLKFNVACLTPLNRKNMEPMFLATTLPVETAKQLSMIVELYSCRWAIETFFFSFKQSLRAGRFRVFSCWEAIDRLLALAHMAFLVLSLLFLLAQRAQTGPWARLWRRAEETLREWFARPLDLGLGEFFQIMALEFAERRWVWEAR